MRYSSPLPTRGYNTQWCMLHLQVWLMPVQRHDRKHLPIPTVSVDSLRITVCTHGNNDRSLSSNLLQAIQNRLQNSKVQTQLCHWFIMHHWITYFIKIVTSPHLCNWYGRTLADVGTLKVQNLLKQMIQNLPYSPIPTNAKVHASIICLSSSLLLCFSHMQHHRTALKAVYLQHLECVTDFWPRTSKLIKIIKNLFSALTSPLKCSLQQHSLMTLFQQSLNHFHPWNFVVQIPLILRPVLLYLNQTFLFSTCVSPLPIPTSH